MHELSQTICDYDRTVAVGVDVDVMQSFTMTESTFSSDIALVIRSHHDLQMKIRHIVIRLLIRPQEILIEIARRASDRLGMSLIVRIPSDLYDIDFFLLSFHLSLGEFHFVFLSAATPSVQRCITRQSRNGDAHNVEFVFAFLVFNVLVYLLKSTSKRTPPFGRG
jgi:hypothetical protein